MSEQELTPASPELLYTSIENFGGLKKLEIEHTSPVIYVTGANGSGKTSFVEAYPFIFDGGSHPEVIGPYGETATVYVKLKLPDERIAEITRVQKRNGATYSIVCDGLKVDRPSEFVKSLVSGLALRPAELLSAPKKERIKMLQQILPMSFTKQELDNASGFDTFVKKPELTLEEFDQFCAATFEKRTQANSAQDTLRSSLQTLKKDLPEGDEETDWSAEVKRLEKAILRADGEISEIRRKALDLEASDIQTVRDELERKIAELRKEADAEIDTIREGYRNTVEQKCAPLNAERGKATAELAVARQNERNIAVIKAKREDIARLDNQYREALQRHQNLDDAVKGLKQLRLQKMSQSPIKGLEIRGEDLYLDGLNVDTQVNKADQILLSFQIMARANRGMNFFILDDAEHLDAQTRVAFMEGCKRKGFQVVLAAAEAGKDLTVEPVQFDERGRLKVGEQSDGTLFVNKVA